jgi:hypothetical protein
MTNSRLKEDLDRLIKIHDTLRYYGGLTKEDEDILLKYERLIQERSEETKKSK